MLAHTLGQEEAGGDHVHAQWEDPPWECGDAALGGDSAAAVAWNVSKLSQRSGGVGGSGVAMGKMRENGGGSWRRRTGPAARGGGTGWGWRWKKDVKMPLSWCKTEIDPGGISVIFKHAL